METKYINSLILALLVGSLLYIAYQFEQDYKWNAFMTCIEQESNPSVVGANGICNIMIFRDTSTYAPAKY